MHRLPKVRVEPFGNVLRYVLKKILACVVVLLSVFLGECDLCLLVGFFDAQLFLGIIASRLYLLRIHLVQSRRLIIVLFSLFRLVVSKVVLLDFGEFLLVLLLVVLLYLLVALLVLNKFVLVVLLCCEIFF